MNKKIVRKWIFILLTVVIIIGSFVIISGAGFKEPGSQEDPIVTLGYVERRLEQIKYYIDQSIKEIKNGETETDINIVDINSELETLKAKIDQLGSGLSNEDSPGLVSSSKFEVVFVEAGKLIYFGDSTEVIWRSGKATAIASQNGGLSNLTIGKDIQTGEEIPLNHLILIPRDDGRGMSVIVDSYVMVKGVYNIK